MISKEDYERTKAEKKINLVFFSLVIEENPVLTTVLEKKFLLKTLANKVGIYFELEKN